jgi:hypothetical protein
MDASRRKGILSGVHYRWALAANYVSAVSGETFLVLFVGRLFVSLFVFCGRD